jgi:hypothetical protein
MPQLHRRSYHLLKIAINQSEKEKNSSDCKVLLCCGFWVRLHLFVLFCAHHPTSLLYFTVYRLSIVVVSKPKRWRLFEVPLIGQERPTSRREKKWRSSLVC